MKKYKIISGICLIAFMINCNGEKKDGAVKDKTNTAPFIKNVVLTPENPTQGSRITMRIDAGDKEGDNIEYSVIWYLNDEKIGEGFEFYLNEAKQGDYIYADITPSDGKLEGETKRTATVAIGNTPPKIMSSRIAPDTVLTSTGDLTVYGEGFDPDGDPITWLCYWTLDFSKRISDSATTINLKNLDIKKGSHITAELYASDGDTVSTPHLIEIDVVNGHPMLKTDVDSVPYSADSINFPVPIIDPDNDEMTFELLEAPLGLRIDKKNGTVSGKVTMTDPFEIIVRATDTDGAYLDARFTLTPPQTP